MNYWSSRFKSLFLAACFLPAMALRSHAELPADLDTYIRDGMKQWSIPGLAIAVIKDDAVVYMSGFGTRRHGSPEAVDADTIFAIGSTTKAFTAAAIAKLVEKELIEWDEPVVGKWPAFKLSEPYITSDIRFTDLLANHAGLSVASESLWYGTEFTRQEIVDRLQFVPFESGFRYEFQYRNVMFLLAGMSIPQIDGRPWEKFVTDEFFVPLGMSRTLPDNQGLDTLANVATPHILNYERVPEPIRYRNMTNISPAGSIFSSVRDMARWTRMQLNSGEIDGQRILEEDSIKFMHSPVTPVRTSGPGGKAIFPSLGFPAYCLAWVTGLYGGERIVYHNGDIDGMAAWVGLVPDQHLGVVVLSNLDSAEFRTAVFYKIVDAYLKKTTNDIDPTLLERFEAKLQARANQQAEWEKLRTNPVTPDLPIASYAGTYQNSWFGTVTLKLENGALVYERTPEQTLDLLPSGGNTFLARYRNPIEDLRIGKEEIEFTVEANTVKSFEESEQSLYRILNPSPAPPASPVPTATPDIEG